MNPYRWDQKRGPDADAPGEGSLDKPMPARDLPAEVTEYLDRVIDDALQAGENARSATGQAPQKLATPGSPPAEEDGLESETAQTVLGGQSAPAITSLNPPAISPLRIL